MTTENIYKFVFSVFLIVFVMASLISCSSSDNQNPDPDASDLDLSFPAQSALANSSAVIDSLQAHVAIDGGEPFPLDVDRATKQVSGTMSRVPAGTRHLVITYYIEMTQGSGGKLVLATCSKTVTVTAGQTSEVIITDDDLNIDYDDDNDGCYNLDEVKADSDPMVPDSCVASIEVTPTNPSIAMGTAQQFTATGIIEGRPPRDITAQVTWSSSDNGVATVSNDTGTEGLADSLAEGSTTISASMGSISGSTGLTVVDVLESIQVAPTNPAIVQGTTQQFTATGIFGDRTQDLTAQTTWSSSDNDVATVSNAAGSEGMATGVAHGSTTISASYSDLEASTELTVEDDKEPESIEIAPMNPSITIGTTQQFTATIIFTDQSTQDITTQATWSSSVNGVATISNVDGTQGLATSVAEGSTIISASLGSISGSTELIVADVLVSIQVAPTNPAIVQGTTQQFTATGIFGERTQDLTAQATWSSSDNGVATVSNAAGSEGLATGVAHGSTTISTSYNDLEASTELTVEDDKEPESVEIAPTNPSITLGTTQQFTATVIFTDQSTQDITTQATWSSSVNGVATVSNADGTQGLATSVAEGSTTISASYGALHGSTELTVVDELESIAVTPTDPAIALGTTQQFTATGTFSSREQDITSQVTWSSSDNGVATVSNAAGNEGLATSLTDGSTTIRASYEDVHGSTDLTVIDELESIEVAPTNPSINLGTVQQFTATGIFSNREQDLTSQVTWSSSDNGVATVSNAPGTEGRATSVAFGNTTISASYEGKTDATQLTVEDKTPESIAVTPANPSIEEGERQRFRATVTYRDQTTQNLTNQVTWSSSNTGVATVSNADGLEGRATGVRVGSTTITASYQGISGSTGLTVTRPPECYNMGDCPSGSCASGPAIGHYECINGKCVCLPD